MTFIISVACTDKRSLRWRALDMTQCVDSLEIDTLKRETDICDLSRLSMTTRYCDGSTNYKLSRAFNQ